LTANGAAKKPVKVPNQARRISLFDAVAEALMKQRPLLKRSSGSTDPICEIRALLLVIPDYSGTDFNFLVANENLLAFIQVAVRAITRLADSMRIIRAFNVI
jgi:hypothetical protein